MRLPVALADYPFARHSRNGAFRWPRCFPKPLLDTLQQFRLYWAGLQTDNRGECVFMLIVASRLNAEVSL